MKTDTADQLRAKYLELCQELIDSVQAMRNYAMKPGNAWLAKQELGKVSQLTAEVESLLGDIKREDDNGTLNS